MARKKADSNEKKKEGKVERNLYKILGEIKKIQARGDEADSESLCSCLKLSGATFSRYINALCEVGKVEKIKRGKKFVYQLKQAEEKQAVEIDKEKPKLKRTGRKKADVEVIEKEAEEEKPKPKRIGRKKADVEVIEKEAEEEKPKPKKKGAARKKTFVEVPEEKQAMEIAAENQEITIDLESSGKVGDADPKTAYIDLRKMRTEAKTTIGDISFEKVDEGEKIKPYRGHESRKILSANFMIIALVILIVAIIAALAYFIYHLNLF